MENVVSSRWEIVGWISRSFWELGSKIRACICEESVEVVRYEKGVFGGFVIYEKLILDG